MEEMVEAVPGVEREALGRGVVVVEAEARVDQPMSRERSERSWCQYPDTHEVRSPWVSLLSFAPTTRCVLLLS